MNDGDGHTESTETAVSAAHLVACSLLYRIPLMLEGIWSQ